MGPTFFQVLTLTLCVGTVASAAFFTSDEEAGIFLAGVIVFALLLDDAISCAPNLPPDAHLFAALAGGVFLGAVFTFGPRMRRRSGISMTDTDPTSDGTASKAATPFDEEIPLSDSFSTGEPSRKAAGGVAAVRLEAFDRSSERALARAEYCADTAYGAAVRSILSSQETAQVFSVVAAAYADMARAIAEVAMARGYLRKDW